VAEREGFSPPFRRPPIDRKPPAYPLSTDEPLKRKRSRSNVPPRIGARFVQPLYGVHCGLTKLPSQKSRKRSFSRGLLGWSGRRESNPRMQLGKVSSKVAACLRVDNFTPAGHDQQPNSQRPSQCDARSCVAAESKTGHLRDTGSHVANNLLIYWRSLGELNPCFSLERANQQAAWKIKTPAHLESNAKCGTNCGTKFFPFKNVAEM
jgi:hypothetical protein